MRLEQSPPTSSTKQSLEYLKKVISSCVQCPLSQGRTTAVFGEGPENAQIMFLGEAPGKDEDKKGRPFVGRSGKLFNECLLEAGIERSSVFITNVVKCRPPQNRKPNPKEMDLCRPYLEAQIRIIEPKVICLLGNVATKAILNREGVTSLHGQVFQQKFLVTLHPAAVLRNRNFKELFISDLKKARTMAENDS